MVAGNYITNYKKTSETVDQEYIKTIPKTYVTYFQINHYNFHVDPGAESESELNIIKNKLNVPSKSWGYNDIQWTNFSGENMDLTIYSRINEQYTGEPAQPEKGGITNFYEKARTPHAVLKYWAQNFVPCQVETNLHAFENGKYVIETFKQSQPSFDFVITNLTLIKYEKPQEVNQSYYSPTEYNADSSTLNAGVSEVTNLTLHSQNCDCNQYTPALQCTASVNEEVKTIQKYLQKWGYFPTHTKKTKTIKPTGKYCYNTTKAISKFQKAMGIPVSGDFTEETKNAFLKKIAGK